MRLGTPVSAWSAPRCAATCLPRATASTHRRSPKTLGPGAVGSGSTAGAGGRRAVRPAEEAQGRGVGGEGPAQEAGDGRARASGEARGVPTGARAQLGLGPLGA